MAIVGGSDEKNRYWHCGAIIPVRYGKKRFPGKIITSILEKIFFQRAYENANQLSLLS